MEEKLLEMQYNIIKALCLENSAEFPTREEVYLRFKEMLLKDNQYLQ